MSTKRIRNPKSKYPGRPIRQSSLLRALRNSKSVYDVCKQLGVQNGSVYRAMRRFRISNPPAWHETHKERVATLRRSGISSIIHRESDRAYVGILIGTKAAIMARYENRYKNTKLLVPLGMTDRPWVAKFARLCRLGPPSLRPSHKKGHSDVWYKEISGLRALIILKDVRRYLLGEKLAEARRATEFFSPTGYRRGEYRSSDVWPPSEFPLRRKGPSKKVR